MATEPVLIPVIDEGLGNSTYLLELGDGRALVLDPERDLRQVRAEARRRGLTITHAVETHLHADFVSGVRELAEAEGAAVLAPEIGPRGFAVSGLTDGDTVRAGAFTLRALATPGHSPEHLSFLLEADGTLLGVFTGGSLMVGTAGRTDLVSPDRTVPLARAQYHSLQRLMELPDDTPVWPTHGPGSFCSSAGGGERTSTIGRERATNPLLKVDGEDAFVDALLASMGSFPDYFLRLADVNQHGPAVLGDAPSLKPLKPLTVPGVRDLLAADAQVVDVRSIADFAAGHVPGATSIPLRTVFASWFGWLVDPGRPVVIVRAPDQSPEDIAWEAAKVGFDALAGELDGGMPRWEEHSATATATVGLGRADELAGADRATVLDVRQDSEFGAGHAPGAHHIELGALEENLARVPHGPLVVMCGHGERAMGAASILLRAGRTDVQVMAGGPADWAKASGREPGEGA